jgi:carbonic anhydrase
MEKIKRLFLENKAWAKSKLLLDESYFENMAKDQTPEYLWIGCSDSRVPPSEITNTDPGEMFVHRNIANLVVHTDMNLLSVVQYAVENLKVKHVIVCGHYNCGGVKAAMSHQSFGLLNNWIRNIKDTYSMNEKTLKAVESETDKVNLLVELNVKEQVKNLMHTSIIQKAWKDTQLPHLHGWVYDLKTGLLKDLVTVHPGTEIEEAYRYDV